MSLTEVDYKEVKNLDKTGLTRLAYRLLLSEARSAGIAANSIQCSFDVDTGDGGQDAAIKWTGGPNKTDYLDRDTLVQIKATAMSATKCRKELVGKDGNLKPAVQKLFERGGTYILFCNTDTTDNRVEAFQEIAKSYNFPSARILSYNPTQIAEWTNRYFSAVTLVKELVGNPSPVSLRTWKQWSKFAHSDVIFVADDTLNKYIENIKKAAKTPRSVVRICGLPGLGKTRLVTEAFSDSELNNLAVFVNACGQSGYFTAELASWLQPESDGILIVDNCPASLHKILAEIALHAHSKLTLITLDSDPDEVSKAEEYIELKPLDKSLIIKMIKQKFPEMPDQAVQTIAEFAEGYPQMAVLMCEADLREEGSFSKLTFSDLMNRLLFPKGTVDKTALEVISACALFDKFAFDDGQAGETALIAKTICKMDVDQFCRIAMQFKKRGILEPHMGAYTKVTPKPLAWRLASDWWDSCSNTLADLLINNEWPTELAQAMCGQLAFLNDTKSAHKVAEKLCQPNCPFVSAESLNSTRGSRLFRALVEVDPEVTLSSLERVFLDATRKELFEATEGRRYLIWALEQLCWHAEQFERAAFLLYKFADAENELNIRNNATGQLLSLFHVYLPGTKANLRQRIQLLDTLLETTPPDDLVVSCLCAGFSYGPFSRMGGVEQQGGRLPEKDYEPTGDEIKEYWNEILKRLLPLLKNQTHQNKILNHLGSMFLYLTRFGLIDEVEKIVQAKEINAPLFWVEGLERLSMALKESSSKLKPEAIARVQKLIEKLGPQSFEEKYRLIVSEASYSNYDREKDGKIVDVNKLRAENFGKECGNEWPKWRDKLPLLFKGEQREVFGFATGLAQTLKQSDEFVQACLDYLIATPEELNPSVLAEYCAAIRSAKSSIIGKVLDETENNPKLNRYAPWLIYRLGIDDDAIDRYMRMLKKGKIKLAGLVHLKYGGVLQNVSEKKMHEFLDFILADDAMENQQLGLELAHTFAYRSDERWKSIKDIVRIIIMRPGFLKSLAELAGTMIIHDWQDVTLRFLKFPDSAFAIAVTEEIIAICGIREDRIIYHYDQILAPILTILIRDYFSEIWPLIGAKLEGDDWKIKSDLKLLLANQLSFHEEPQPILSAPADKLAAWCEDHEQTALLLMGSVRLWQNGNQLNMSLNELGQRLLDLFGSNPKFLNALNANIDSIAMAGIESLRPQYEARQQLMRQLQKHKHAAVRRWASLQLKYYEKRIESAKKREEEEKHGIFGGLLREGF